MKLVIATTMILVTSLSFAGESKRNPAATLPTAVKELETKLKSRSDLRTRTSVYSVSEEDANACSEAGTHYNVKVQVKKPVRVADKAGNPQIKYVWETVREVDTKADGEAMEICAE